MISARHRSTRLIAAIALLGVIWPVGALAQSRSELFIVAQGADPRSLSPLSSTVQQELNVSNQIVERLINFTPAGDGFVPGLAESWEVVSPTVLRLHLRRGVAFTNGEPFDAEAAKYSLEQMKASTAHQSFVEAVDTFEIVDEYTIDAISNQPTPEGLRLNALAMSSFMYPPVYTEAEGIYSGFGNRPVGTGPFQLSEWVKDDHVTLKANPDYWAGAPAIAYLQFRPIPEPAVRLAALEAGDIDFMIDVSLDGFQRLQGSRNIVTVSAEGGRAYRLTLTMLEPDGPFADLRVRQAARMSVDADAIIEYVLQGAGERITQMATPAVFGYNPDIPEVGYDPDRARALLAEAGYPDGISVKFDYTSGRYPMDKEIGELIAAQMAEAGFKIRQNVLESGEFINRLLDRTLKDFYYSGGLTPPDAHFQYTSYTCDFVYSYYCNPEYDELFFAASVMTDNEERAAAYRRLGEILFEDAHIVPLFTMNDLYAYRKGLEGWTPMRTQFLDFHDATIGPR